MIKLRRIISRMDSVLIAFSGGADSTFLLKIASMVLPKDKILAVTVDSAVFPAAERQQAVKLAKAIGVKHKTIKLDILKNKNVFLNSRDRCYFCKKMIMIRLKRIAEQGNFRFVIDAGNASDKNDFRPGEKAKKELFIRSPLWEAGITKEDIRRFSRKLGLTTWDKPSLACLASRIPYGMPVTREKLLRIDEAEKYIRSLGFRQVRVRDYEPLASIEVKKNDIAKLLSHKPKALCHKLRKLGYTHVTIDLNGYRTGSLNR